MPPELPAMENRVMIVDDAAIVRESFARALKKAGLTITTAESGPEALERLEKKPVHALLLDLKMPRMTGLETLRVVRRLWPATEVIIITAYPGSEMVQEARKLGALAVIVKPMANIHRLIKTAVQAVIRSRLRQKLPLEPGPLLEFVLLDQGRLPEREFQKARDLAEKQGLPLSIALIRSGVIDEHELDRAVTSFLEVPFVHLDSKMLDPGLIAEFPLSLARKYQCLPLVVEEGALHVVTSDPFNDQARQHLETFFDKPLALVKGDPGEITAALEKIADHFPRLLSGPELLARLSLNQDPEPALLLASLFQRAGVILEKAEFGGREHGACRFCLQGRLTLDENETAAGPAREDQTPNPSSSPGPTPDALPPDPHHAR